MYVIPKVSYGERFPGKSLYLVKEDNVYWVGSLLDDDVIRKPQVMARVAHSTETINRDRVAIEAEIDGCLASDELDDYLLDMVGRLENEIFGDSGEW